MASPSSWQVDLEMDDQVSRVSQLDLDGGDCICCRIIAHRWEELSSALDSRANAGKLTPDPLE